MFYSTPLIFSRTRKPDIGLPGTNKKVPFLFSFKRMLEKRRCKSVLLCCRLMLLSLLLWNHRRFWFVLRMLTRDSGLFLFLFLLPEDCCLVLLSHVLLPSFYGRLLLHLILRSLLLCLLFMIRLLMLYPRSLECSTASNRRWYASPR